MLKSSLKKIHFFLLTDSLKTTLSLVYSRQCMFVYLLFFRFGLSALVINTCESKGFFLLVQVWVYVHSMSVTEYA